METDPKPWVPPISSLSSPFTPFSLHSGCIFHLHAWTPMGAEVLHSVSLIGNALPSRGTQARGVRPPRSSPFHASSISEMHPAFLGCNQQSARRPMVGGLPKPFGALTSQDFAPAPTWGGVSARPPRSPPGPPPIARQPPGAPESCAPGETRAPNILHPNLSIPAWRGKGRGGRDLASSRAPPRYTHPGPRNPPDACPTSPGPRPHPCLRIRGAVVGI